MQSEQHVLEEKWSTMGNVTDKADSMKTGIDLIMWGVGCHWRPSQAYIQWTGRINSWTGQQERMRKEEWT